MTSDHSPRMMLWRPTLSHLWLNMVVAGYMLAVLNAGFWERLLGIFSGKPLQVAAFGLASFALTVLMLEFFGLSRLQKPVAALLIVIAAASSYFEQVFGVLIDREMIRNVMETTPTEAGHLVTLSAVLNIGLLGVLPAALVFWPHVRRVSGVHHLWRWPLGVATCFGLVAGGLMMDFKAFSAVLRERHDLMGSYQPGATVTAIFKFGKEQFASAMPEAQPIATDARRGAYLASADKPVLLVFFAGETARAQNFGLNGYARDTTPGLRDRGVINYPDVSSCGTSTAVSLPCMFSALPKAEYSREKFLSQFTLLDVIERVGFDAQWFENNAGEYDIAARTGVSRVDATLDPAACEIECTDEIFLPIIENTLATITSDTVLVLHMIGNHGPAYYLRYPPERAPFQPDCPTAEFAKCAVEQVVNSYDNAIYETDYVLSRSIDMLQASDRAYSAVIFLSDHGESLGENGLYLHAAPMFMAPEMQTKVPMVMWLSDSYSRVMGIDTACLMETAQRPASQDNVFHTVLGLLDIQTDTRQPALDLTEGCRMAAAQL
jgi:lipid A ethanolaminephosphotransferase